MVRSYKSLLTVMVMFFQVSFVVAQERPMSLSDVLAAADSGSVSLRAARIGVDAARERADAADRGTLLPDVQLSAAVGYLGDGYGWGRDSSYSFSVDMPHFSTRFGVEAQQVVYAGGAMASARRQAALGVRLADITLAQQRQDVRMQLAGHYLDLYRADRQLEVLDSNIAHTRTLIADISARHEEGTALRNDLTRYELQLAQLQMRRTTVENDRSIANASIVNLCGMAEGVRIVPDSSFLNAAKPALAGGAQPLTVQRAEAMAEMADAKERQSRAALLPYVALVAQDQVNGPVTIDITPYNINYNYWFVGLAVSYNLSSLWKQRSDLRGARLEQTQRAMELQAADDASRLAVESAVTRLDEACRNLTIKRKSVELAGQNYTLVANRYRNDLTPLSDMLDASNARLSAELDLVSARLNVAYREMILKYLKGEL